MKNLIGIFLVSVIVLFSIVGYSLAATDLSINVNDITFSKEEALKGDTVRIFARVFNLGNDDVRGFVQFLNNDREMADSQPISVKINTYDDVFIDWIAIVGNNNIQAKIIGTNLRDTNQINDSAIKENYFVDLDTDEDKIGNNKDLDDDNDGLSDEQEAILGTDPLNPDTDGDKIKDNIDVFPKDKTEWQDTDQDGIGNNKDTDNDNDDLLDKDEIFVLGTNPLNADSDSDGLNDKKEIEVGTNPIKADTDGDGVVDSKDPYPLDPTKMTAGLLGVLEDLFGKDLLYSPSFWIRSAAVIILLLIIYLWWRRKRRMRE